MTRKEVVKDLRRILRNVQDSTLFSDSDFDEIISEDGTLIDTSRVYQYVISHVQKY